MGLFDFLKKRNKQILPEQYQGIISKDDYKFVIELAVKYHTEKQINVLSTDNGDILTEMDGGQQHRYLDNLVRVLSGNDKYLWETITFEHFDKIQEHGSAYNYLFSDFEYASQFLRVLIKDEDIGFQGKAFEHVHRVDYPKTRTYLVLEFEDQFRYINPEDAEKWNVNREELFNTAIANTPGNEIDIKEVKFTDEFTVYFFKSGDFSASLTLDLKNRADFAIGRYGSMVAIPTKGTAFVHPIETGKVLDLAYALYPTVEKFFNEDPSSINTNFYWDYQGRKELFPVVQEGDKYFIRMPDDLLKIFEK
jgi:hypothetical protein